MDGVASLTQPPIAPGASFEYRFRPPDAGTYWYHAQREGSVLTHTLYGVLIVEEPESIDIEREALLVLDDWRLRTGSLDPEVLPDADRGNMSSHLIINGHPAADILVKTNERLRLRVLNAGMERMFSLRIERHRVMVMGIDGQPSEPFQARDGRVTLGPGNRVDLFVDMTLAAGENASLFVEDGQTQGSIGRLVYMDGEPVRRAPRETSPPLPANELPARMAFQNALRLDLRLEHLSEQQQALPEVGDLAPIALFSAKRGRTVMLALRNGILAPHMVHLHGHHFRLLDRLDDGWKPYWLDTITLAPGQTSRIAFIADNPGKWLIESRKLAARRPMTSAWFAVT
jgi:FtsP/CotA-like multicopper oxidase with cupredoxin domain